MVTQDVIEILKKLQDILVKKYDLEAKRDEARWKAKRDKKIAECGGVAEMNKGRGNSNFNWGLWVFIVQKQLPIQKYNPFDKVLLMKKWFATGYNPNNWQLCFFNNLKLYSIIFSKFNCEFVIDVSLLFFKYCISWISSSKCQTYVFSV